MGESEYTVSLTMTGRADAASADRTHLRACPNSAEDGARSVTTTCPGRHSCDTMPIRERIFDGLATSGSATIRSPGIWPTHCYGMVGVGRNYSPDTGSGAELYTVIGHAPRHLDRNIALVGRVIEGMQHLSSLPRGSGDLGFYTAEEAGKRTPILSVRVASDLAPAEQPSFEYLSTESATFATYAEAIANRRDPFFIVPAGGADICNIRVPVRRVAG